jgi:ArsR family transcriptional regulator, arsenate/arsenite/antimonite-responsive transcriptional repressor
MQYKIEEQTALFKALSDENRLRIVDMLSCGELCACKLLEHFNITQPTLSHHMKVLTDCGLVVSRKDGIWTHYCLNNERVEALIGFIRHVTSDKEDCICKQASCEKDCEPCV